MIVIGNIIALIASLIMVYTGILKNKKKIIYFQTIQIGLFVISNLVLGGISGAIINAISVVRNILSYKDKLDFNKKIVITILSTALILIFNNLGFIGLLPLISTVTFIWIIDIKNIKKFKILFAFTVLLWFIYDINIKSYTSAIFDLATIIANVFVILKK